MRGFVAPHPVGVRALNRRRSVDKQGAALQVHAANKAARPARIASAAGPLCFDKGPGRLLPPGSVRGKEAARRCFTLAEDRCPHDESHVGASGAHCAWRFRASIVGRFVPPGFHCSSSVRAFTRSLRFSRALAASGLFGKRVRKSSSFASASLARPSFTRSL